jgi:hypothetical protein
MPSQKHFPSRVLTITADAMPTHVTKADRNRAELYKTVLMLKAKTASVNNSQIRRKEVNKKAKQ